MNFLWILMHYISYPFSSFWHRNMFRPLFCRIVVMKLWKYMYITHQNQIEIFQKKLVSFIQPSNILFFCSNKIIDLHQMRVYFWVIRKLVLIQNQYEMRYVIDMIHFYVFYCGKVFLKLKLVLKLSNINFHFENGLITQNFFVGAIDFHRISIYKRKMCNFTIFILILIKARKRLLIKQYSLQITFYKRQG